MTDPPTPSQRVRILRGMADDKPTPEQVARILRAMRGDLEGIVRAQADDGDGEVMQLAGHLAFVCDTLSDLIEATGYSTRPIEADPAWHEGDETWEQAWTTFDEAAGPPVPEPES